MTFQSWLRGLTHGPAHTLNKPRRSAVRTRYHDHVPGVERLEDRTLLSSYGLGLAIGVGSTGIEDATGVATDASGNVLVAGIFSSASLDLDPGPAAYVLPNAGGYDGFVAQYDPAGNLTWAVQVGGTGSQSVLDVAVDGAGNGLISGRFSGSVVIGAPGQPAVTLTNGGSSEGFLAKIDTAGNTLWARTFGAAADPRFARGITADAAGNVYATGTEGNRLFVAKYSADGAAVWTQVVSEGTGKIQPSGSISLAQGEDLAVDASSNVYVTGFYRGKIDFDTDPKKTNSLTSVGSRDPSVDAFVLKLNATGAYVWAGSMGGQGGENATEVAVDGSGNVVVFGGYDGVGPSDFDPGRGTLNLSTPNGSVGTFLVKLDPNRNLLWGRGGVGGGYDMALDAAGNVYTTGAFSGTIDADPGPETFNLTAGGTGDVYVSKLSSSGSFVWAADILTGGTGSNGTSFGIAVDGSGNVYTTGFFRGTVDFDPSAGTYSLTATPDGNANLFSDAFVSKLVPSSSLLAAAPALNTSVQSAADSPVTSFTAEFSTASSAITVNVGSSFAPSSPLSLSERQDRATELTRNASVNAATLPFGRRPSLHFGDLAVSTDTLDTIFSRWEDWAELLS